MKKMCTFHLGQRIKMLCIQYFSLLYVVTSREIWYICKGN
nr:MAG TPA: hypothetical protein [Bacteriophage sp.]